MGAGEIWCWVFGCRHVKRPRNSAPTAAHTSVTAACLHHLLKYADPDGLRLLALAAPAVAGVEEEEH